MVGLGAVLGLRHLVAGKRSGRDLSWMPFGVARVAPRCGQSGAGEIAGGRVSLGLGFPLVHRSGHLPSLAPNEVRWLGRPCQVAWALDGRDLATPTPRHGACACAFALAQAASAGVQPRGIAGAWLVPHVGVFG